MDDHNENKQQQQQQEREKMKAIVDASRKEHKKKLSTQDGYNHLLSGFVVAFLKDSDGVDIIDFESLNGGGMYTVHTGRRIRAST